MLRALVAPFAWVFTSLEKVERGFWTIVVGLLGLLIGATGDWYTVPTTLATSFTGPGRLEISGAEPAEAVVLRVLLAALCGLMLAALVAGERYRFALRFPVWLMFVAVLAFPYAVNLWEPDLTLDAQLVWNSNEATTWEQIDNSYQQQQVAYRADQRLFVNGRRMYWVENPMALMYPAGPGGGGGMAGNAYGAVVEPVAEGLDLSAFRFSRHFEVIPRILGYSSTFTNLAGRGWYFGAMGLFVLLSGLYLHSGRGARAFNRDMRIVMPVLLLIIAALIGPRMVAEQYVTAANRAVAAGDNRLAESYFREAAQWKPILRYQLNYQAALGELTEQRNCATCAETLLGNADQLMQRNSFSAAIDLLEWYRRLYPDRPEARYWMGFAYIQRGVNLFNANQASAAAEDFLRGLSYTPTDSLAWYGLALAELRLQDWDAAATAMANVAEVQRFFFFKGAPPKGQWYAVEAWAALRRGDVPLAHHFYSIGLTPEEW
jgi:tetratricopeptide (TPR) repeat protein